ncbi:MAG TPA: bifunctional metallophosphatase/5'-nucleotidase [Gaiellaceae bacterium]|nr:bifunctional metallophosphatase/5'-nucleotidase [Gaiellaceae bacterium]
MRYAVTRRWFRWATPVVLAGIAVTVVLAAPLASPRSASANVVISGAKSLSDRVSVTYADKRATATTDVHILAFNDLHGTLDPAGQNIYGHYAGGAAYLAKAIKDRQALYGDRQATVFGGDNIGASQLANGLFHEEPITIATNLMNVDFGSVGNHEFDKGKKELRRIQNGGCHPVDGCTAAPYALPNGKTTKTFPGANFQYLSANVFLGNKDETLFPPFAVKEFKSNDPSRKFQTKFQVGFIGEVLESTPTIVTPSGVEGLTFKDEADSANAILAKKGGKAKHVDVWVLVIHEGGLQTAPAALNGCNGNLAGSAIADIASRLDPRIKVIVSAHTHAEYRCTITAGGVTRLITSASSFGRILTDITLTIDNDSHDLIAASAENSIVDNATNAPPAARVPDPSKQDPAVQAVVDQYVAASAPLSNRVIGRAEGDLTRAATPLGESALGDVIADAQYVATHPADLGGAAFAFMNAGGIRQDLLFNSTPGGEAPGEVTYGEAFTVQPFGNSLVTKTMTGDMIRRVLQQQFQGCQGQTLSTRVMQISSTFSYEQDPAAATCDGKIGRMWVNGVEVGPTDTFRVTMNNFLAFGGDGFTVFTEGTNALGGAQDIDALVDYFEAAEPGGIAVPPRNRIVAKT